MIIKKQKNKFNGKTKPLDTQQQTKQKTNQVQILQQNYNLLKSLDWVSFNSAPNLDKLLAISCSK